MSNKKPKTAIVPVGDRKVYRGVRGAGSINWNASPELIAIEAKVGVREARFLGLYFAKGSATAAAKALDPTLSRSGAAQRGHKILSQLRKKLDQSDWDTLHGLFRSKVISTIAGALGAMQKKTFVIPRTGQIVESPPEPDWANRLRAAELGTKVLKLNDDAQQQLIVNIVRYAPIDAPPWPGSEGDIVDTESISPESD